MRAERQNMLMFAGSRSGDFGPASFVAKDSRYVLYSFALRAKASAPNLPDAKLRYEFDIARWSGNNSSHGLLFNTLCAGPNYSRRVASDPPFGSIAAPDRQESSCS